MDKSSHRYKIVESRKRKRRMAKRIAKRPEASDNEIITEFDAWRKYGAWMLG